MAPPVPATPTEQADGFCNNLRLNAVLGAELELNEGWARSGYGAWGVYCMKRLQDGQIGFGLAGQAAVYAGDPGNGHFSGHLIAGGFGMMRTWNSGQDLEAKIMLGDYLSTYNNEDGYRQREHHPMLAFSVAHNDYSPRLRGETSMPERQLFGMVGLPIGGGCTSSWQGTPLEGCSNMSLYYNAGVRQWVDNNLYVQAGILGEIRSGDDLFSCSLRVGYANNRRTIGVHAGINACSGGIVPAVGIWYDLGTDLRLKRAARRAASVSVDTGEGREATSTFSGRRLSSTRRDRE